MVIVESLGCVRSGAPLFQKMGVCLLPGAILALRGSNGSGKSSLLKIMAGLRRPDEGSVGFRHGCDAQLTEHVAYMGHKDALFPEYTVHEQLLYWAALCDAKGAVEPAIRFYGLEVFRDREASTLSAGWRKRVALARVMCSERPVWLLDEPETFLDDDGKNRLMHAASSRCYNGGVVVVATNGNVEDLAKRAFAPIAELHIADFA